MTDISAIGPKELKYYFIWDLTDFVMCHQYTFSIAHMEIELESHSFQHWTLGSYVLSTHSDLPNTVSSVYVL